MRRMEEAIEILRLTSSREDVDYDGQYWALPQPHRAAASCSTAYSDLGHRQPQPE
jgi:hypothetical protein